MTEDDDKKRGFWGSTLSKFKSALGRTKTALVDSIVEADGEEEAQAEESTQASSAPEPRKAEPKRSTATATQKKAEPPRMVNQDYLDDVEEKLIRADVGASTAEMLVSHMRKEALAKSWTHGDVESFLRREFLSILKAAPGNELKIDEKKVSLILVVGVNGTGKTTSIGKLCARLKNDGKKVLLGAGDTFRAAAETQLEIWAERAGVDIVRLPDGTDPGAVVFKAIERARAEQYDVLVIDTAGRLHNKSNLMAELKKIRQIIEKNASDFALEVLLVVDASVGQNGLQQAKIFAETCNLTGVILTKLDGSAKGGIVFSIARDLKLPVKLVGLGEKLDDLRDFDSELFVEALFAK